MFVTSQTVRRKQIFTEITCVNFELSVKTAWYTIAPLVAIALLIVFSAFYQQPTPKQIEVLPWIVGLFFIGMPHGAADLAVLQSKKSGWRLFNTFFWYVVSMIGVLIAFILTPTISLVGFLFLASGILGVQKIRRNLSNTGFPMSTSSCLLQKEESL